MELAFTTDLPLWAINLFLAGLVYSRAPQKATNRAFAAFVLTMVGWSVCVKMVFVSTAQPPGILLKRLPFVAASLIGSSFVVFCQVFPDRESLSRSKGTWILMLLGAVMAGLSLTPLVLRETDISGTGRIQPHYGALYPAFGAFMLGAFGHGLWTLTRKWWTARGRSRLQIHYLWLGLCLLIGGGTTTNLIIPALTGNSRFGAYGPYFSVFLIGFTAHAIIRHRLMDIRVVLSKGVTYGLSLGAVVGIIYAVFTLVGKELTLQLSPSLLALFMAIAGMVVCSPVRAAIQRFLDRYCYREVYNYRQAIKTISQMLAGLLQTDALCEQLTAFIFNTLKVEEVGVYLRRNPHVLERRSRLSASEGRSAATEPVTVAAPNVIAVVTRASGPVLCDELGLWGKGNLVRDLANEFARLGGEVITPLSVEGQVVALVVVGEKLSGDPFFQHDLELLATVGHQAGVALKRAQLYEEVTWVKEYSESILQHMESGVIAASQDGSITLINDAGARMIGVKAVEVVGSPATRLIPCELQLPLLDTLRGKTSYTNYEAVLVPASGRSLPIVLSTSVLRGQANEPIGAILVFNNLSHIKALEEEKLRVERLASIGAFMSGITHEIKNPLVAIKTFAELLPERYADEEFRESFARVTLHEVDRIDALVRRLRSLSAGSALLLAPMSIIAPLEETLSLLSGECARWQIRVARRYQPWLPPVMADHDQLKQVFVNLCLNGIEAMREGGTLTITVGSDHGQEGRASKLIIEISDTGAGICPEHLSHIFEPFFTSKDKGSGLGLAICRGIIDYHRGSLSAANHTDGPGAVFTVTLPAVQGEDAHEVTTPGR